MKYHLVIDAWFGTCEKQAGELTGFIEKSDLAAEQGNTIIICGGQMDGDDKQRLAEMVPTKSVIFVILEEYNPELILDFLESHIEMQDLYLFGAGYSGEELAVRLGKRMDGSSLSGCQRLRVIEDEGAIEVEKTVYSGHMKGIFRLVQTPYCVALAKGQEPAENEPGQERELTEIDLRGREEDCGLIQEAFAPLEGGNDLEQARFLVVAGRGIRKKETAAAIAALADRIGAGYGASRPAVMNAWVPMEKLIGASGIIAAPVVCITLGVSGAPALYTGIEKSKFIVAVNTDERAPIMKKADVAIAGDAEALMAALAEQMEVG